MNALGIHEERRLRLAAAAATQRERDAERPLPHPSELAALLFSRPDGEAGPAKRRVLHHYAAVWAVYEGVPPVTARQLADELADSAQMTSEERALEQGREDES